MQPAMHPHSIESLSFRLSSCLKALESMWHFCNSWKFSTHALRRGLKICYLGFSGTTALTETQREERIVGEKSTSRISCSFYVTLITSALNLDFSKAAD